MTISYLIILGIIGIVSLGLIPDATALIIGDNSTGGECFTVGTWNATSRTCTLTSDVNEGIVMGANAITLDGNGHKVTSPSPGMGNGIFIQVMFGITIKNLEINDFSRGIDLNNALDISLLNNSIIDSSSIGIIMNASPNGQISNNLINGANTHAILVLVSDDSSFDNNTILNTPKGIEINNSLRPIVKNNNFSNGVVFGISLDASSVFGNITNNIVNDMGIGISLVSSGGEVLIMNNTANNNIVGIRLNGASNYTVVDNIFSGNTNGGEILDASPDSTIKENTFSNNSDKGLLIKTGNSIKVFNNNFIDNTISATSTSTNVVFSPSEETGGNYWSDYSPLCANANNDNYCDEPYPFSGGDVNVNDDFVWIQPDGWLTKFNGDDDIVVNATSVNGKIVNYSVSATDDGDPIPVSCVPESGSLFSVGNSTVVCTAQNGIVSSFSVMVNFFDADSDGVGDEFDNCPAIPNQDQSDSDDDGIGDVCEPDTDSDGIIDDDDNCPAVPNPDQADANSNGVGDVCEDPETDTDGDGVPDITDNCPSVSNANQTDLDNDGIGDACDPVSFPFCDSLPQDGNWVIVSSCTLGNSFFAPSNVTVQNNSVLVIPSGSTLSIKLTNNLLIKLGSGVLIESGGAVKLETPPPVNASVSVPAGTSVPGCEETNSCFIPFEVIVGVGGEVTWSNDDTAAHTVTAGSPTDGPSGEFDSSLFFAGATFSHTFESAGTFPYFCFVHPWMNGIVVVPGFTVKELACDFGDSLITDYQFVIGLQSLIDNGEITPSVTNSQEPNIDSAIQIPEWIQNNSGWWCEGAISENNFFQGVDFLVNEGILKFP